MVCPRPRSLCQQSSARAHGDVRIAEAPNEARPRQIGAQRVYNRRRTAHIAAVPPQGAPTRGTKSGHWQKIGARRQFRGATKRPQNRVLVIGGSLVLLRDDVS